jgi:hypothetical protein
MSSQLELVKAYFKAIEGHIAFCNYSVLIPLRFHHFVWHRSSPFTDRDLLPPQAFFEINAFLFFFFFFFLIHHSSGRLPYYFVLADVLFYFSLREDTAIVFSPILIPFFYFFVSPLIYIFSPLYRAQGWRWHRGFQSHGPYSDWVPE